jgi:nucleolar pre-ribosomal-associated protein 1
VLQLGGVWHCFKATQVLIPSFWLQPRLTADLSTASFLQILQLKSRIILKLSLLSSPTIPNLNVLLSQCLISLHHLEKDVVLPTFPFSPRLSFQSRHTSYSSREGSTSESHALLWGEIVVNLWRASMTSRSSREAWDELTPRVLVWNQLIGGDDQVGEWARREVVRNVTSQGTSCPLHVRT